MKNPTNIKIIIIAVILSVILGLFLAYMGLTGLLLYISLVGVLVLIYYIFKDPWYGILSIIFFLPFERIPSVNLGFMNLKVNQILGGITIVSWIFSLIEKKYFFKKFPIFWLLILFWSATGISLFFSGYLPRSQLVYIFILFTSFLSFLVSQFISDKNKIAQIIQILFLSSLVVGFFSIFQFMGDIIGLPVSITGLREGYATGVFGFPRVQAFSIEPLYLGNFLLIPISVFIACYLGKIKNSFITPSLSLIITIFLTIIVGLTFSRGAYLGLAASAFVLFIFLFKKLLKFKIILIALISITIVAGAVYWFVGQGESISYDELETRLTLSDAKDSESINGRLAEFERALTIFQTSPYFGIGIGAYGITRSNFPDPTSIENWDIVNNQYIETLTETGIIGLVAFLILLFSIVIYAFKAIRHCHEGLVKYVLIGLLAAFMGVLVQYNSFSTLYIIHIWVLIGLIIGVSNIALSKHEKI